LARRAGILARRSDAALPGRIHRAAAAGVAAAAPVPDVLLLQDPLVADLVVEEVLQATAEVSLLPAGLSPAGARVAPLGAGHDALGRRQATGGAVAIMPARLAHA